MYLVMYNLSVRSPTVRGRERQKHSSRTLTRGLYEISDAKLRAATTPNMRAFPKAVPDIYP